MEVKGDSNIIPSVNLQAYVLSISHFMSKIGYIHNLPKSESIELQLLKLRSYDCKNFLCVLITF